MDLAVFSLMILILKIEINYACNYKNFVDALVFDGYVLLGEKRFYGCKIADEVKITEVRLKSCLEYVEEETFLNLPDLKRISMVESCIKELSPGFFKNTPNLEEVIFKSNHIAIIRRGTFIKSNMNQIDLSYNRIHTIGSNAFGNFRRLSMLNLAHNRIHEIERTWFLNSAILEINLANNMIMKVDQNSFASVGNLEKVNLEYNNIHTVDKHFKLDSVKSLSLAGNWLSDIEFSRGMKLFALDISFNKISYISGEELASIREMIIHPNPWQCACLRMFWKNNSKYKIVIKESPTLRKQLDSDIPICVVPEDEGHICTFKKDNRLSEIQDRYFQLINYADIGIYS